MKIKNIGKLNLVWKTLIIKPNEEKEICEEAGLYFLASSNYAIEIPIEKINTISLNKKKKKDSQYESKNDI